MSNLRPAPTFTNKCGAKVKLLNVKRVKESSVTNPPNLKRRLEQTREANEFKKAIRESAKPGDVIEIHPTCAVIKHLGKGYNTVIQHPSVGRNYNELIARIKKIAEELPKGPERNVLLEYSHIPDFAATTLKSMGYSIEKMRKLGFHWRHLLISCSFKLEELKKAGMPFEVALSELSNGHTINANNLIEVWPEKEQEILRETKAIRNPYS